jgi:hypothetical protein
MYRRTSPFTGVDALSLPAKYVCEKSESGTQPRHEKAELLQVLPEKGGTGKVTVIISFLLLFVIW